MPFFIMWGERMKKELYIQANQARTPLKMPVRIARTLEIGEEVTEVFKIPADCTLENVYVKFYGSQHMLQVDIRHEQRGTDIANSVISYLGDRQFLSGDFEEYDEPVVRSMRYKDRIIVWAKNTGEQQNTLNVIISLDMYGGTGRVIGG